MNWLRRSCVLIAALTAPAARADIFQWEYVDPFDPSLGKQASATLTPDGAGVDAIPDALLAFKDLTKAYLHGADLTNANALGTTLTSADASLANLSSANLQGATLIEAELCEANLANADL